MAKSNEFLNNPETPGQSLAETERAVIQAAQANQSRPTHTRGAGERWNERCRPSKRVRARHRRFGANKTLKEWARANINDQDVRAWLENKR